MRILVVDDDKDVREQLRRMLKRGDYGQCDVVEIGSLHGAINKLDECAPFDCALLDTWLGKRPGGFLVASACVARNLPFVGMSRDVTMESKWLGCGAVAFLSKPCSPMELAVAIGKATRPRK